MFLLFTRVQLAWFRFERQQHRFWRFRCFCCLHMYRWHGFDLDVSNIDFGGLDVFAVYTCAVGAVSIWTSATSILAV